MSVDIKAMETAVKRIRAAHPHARVTVVISAGRKVVKPVQFDVADAFIKSGRFAAHVRNAVTPVLEAADSFYVYANEGEWA